MTLVEWLHTGPLGSLKDLGGSALVLLLDRGRLPEAANVDLQLRAFCVACRAWCRRCGLDAFKFHLKRNTLAKPNKYPTLLSALKGASTKRVIMFMHE